ncbi:MAG: hypothetical protein SCARUB_01390 [Candidatus Scalindua rubra]|uniref:Uncharacterized protein n=1 Tax=Candidatus Scalindua rubra TaxID=1872076 RepID=A0A1E3XCY3_9BACT|nr:MAG: hypothetical protein SCARUB_01390 [Candidatus Scalindua rubra]
MIYLAFSYCGLTLKEIGQGYGGISDSTVNKVVNHFSTCLSNKKIVSSGEM